ncbi:MAG: DUF1559 domain-containing protein [Thermoguttaceae bacterium]|nr:DUF1559 domain-containing protein [Thermoguttaceae bacterium]
MKLSHSKGFTLVELLVVIAIIGVLVGLTIPAVQAVRATARQTQCLNNVKQLAAAAAAHETTLGYLPNYWGTYGTNNANGNWVVPLLPHLGEGPVWSQWENGKGSTQERYPTLSFLICPIQPAKKKVQAGLSYGANCGYYNGSGIQGDDKGKKVYAYQLGAFVHKNNQRSRISKMKDGASYTILFGENAQAYSWNSSNVYDFGIVWNSNTSTLLNIGMDVKSTTRSWKYARPASRHAQNGAHVAFADGGAQYINKNVDRLTYCQLMAPDDKKAAAYYGSISNPMNLGTIDR